MIATKVHDPTTPGQVITFYSYKGGTGRSMALANAAVLLAGRGHSPVDTLMIDWDLEAPGLHQYFPVRDDQRPMADPARPGLADLFAVLFTTARELQHLDEMERRARVIQRVNALDIDQYIAATDVPGLHLLKAGRLDAEYSDLVNRFRWDEFYDWAPWAFRALTERLIKKYRYVLVDSRTGITDTSSICTSLLPDKLVVVFTPNEQSLNGIRELVERTITHRHESDDLRPLIVYPLPSRIEESEPKERDAWRLGSEERGLVGWQRLFEKTLSSAYDIASCDLSEYFDQVQIRHHPFYAYGEKVAVRIDRGTEVTALPRIYARFVEWLAGRASPWESAEAAAKRQARAIARRVDLVFQSLSGNEQRDVARRMFTRLVKILGQQEVGDFSLRIATIDDFAPDATAVLPVIERFEEQGLLRVERDKSGKIATVQLSDESPVSSWPRFKEWIDNDRVFLLWRQRLDQQVESWLEARRDPSLLLRAMSLEEAVGWWNAHPSDLNDVERQFIEASESHEEVLRLEAVNASVYPSGASRPILETTGAYLGTPSRPQMAVPAAASAPKSNVSRYAIAAGVVIAAALGAYQLFGHSSSHADLVVAAARLSNDPAQSALLLASLDDRDGSTALERSREIAATRLPSAIYPIPGAIVSAALNARGTYVVTTTTDGSAYVRSVRADSGRLLKLPVTDASRGSFSADGRAVLISRRDGSLVVLADSVTDTSPVWMPGRLSTRIPTSAQTVGAALSSDVLAYSIDRNGAFTDWGRVGCCTWKAFSTRARLNPINGVAFSADASTVGLDVVGRGFQLWNTKALATPILTRDVNPRLLALSASGNYAGVVTQDSTAQVWDQIGPTIWQQRTPFATGLAVDQRGEHIALASASGRTLVVSIRAGYAGATDTIELRTPGPVAALSFGEGASLVTASDSTLRVWQLDRALPSDSATWSELRTYFASATNACLTAQDRQTILGESSSAAKASFDRCAERFGLVARDVTPIATGDTPTMGARASGAPVTAPPTTPVQPSEAAKTPSRPAASPDPSDTVDVARLLDGRDKVWTGEWRRGDGGTSSIQFHLRFDGNTVTGRVRWEAAPEADQYKPRTERILESPVNGRFDRRRLEIELKRVDDGKTPGEPATYRLLIVDRRFELRGTVSTTDDVRGTVRASYSAPTAR